VADPGDLESVRRLLEEHRQEVVRAYRAVGTGIGSSEPGGPGYAIVVYLKEKSDMPAEPVALEGVPLKFVVTGEFRPQL
jgi:hypothetical protein